MYTAHRVGSAGVPALILLLQVFLCPESPRWLIGKGRYADAYQSLLRLRNHKILAARDLFMIATMLEEENKIKKGRFQIIELFSVPRNRRAALASFIVMFGQQFCGINVSVQEFSLTMDRCADGRTQVIAYYSASVFSDAGFSDPSAIGASIGFGALK